MMTFPLILQWVVAAFLLLLLYVSFLTLWRHSRGFNKAFRELAARRNGEAETHFFLFPSATIPLLNTTAVVQGTYASQYSSNVVEVEVTAPAPWPGRLVAYPLGYHTAVFSLFLGGRARTGDKRFDRAFTLFGSPPEMAGAIFDAESREALLHAAALGRPGDAVVVLHPTSLKLRKHNVTPDLEALDDLVAAAETLARKVEALRVGKLEIEYLTPPSKEVEGSCPVCGSMLERNVVWCRACNMPHHRDCWKFNHGCATFACGAKGFNRHKRDGS
ncbi:MAG: RING finger protein [Planctomycetota bacterium]|jgi:hypothetical protein